MAIFKCKMCGGALEVMDGATTGECQYCGTMQTLPKLNDDKKANMYDRANHFRRNNEFDKARAIYEQILNEDNTDAESYWSIILCQYGIEYVEDPMTHKRVPTVNRAQFTSVLADENYKKAIEYADVYQKSIYEEEAKAIDEIQKGILAISQKEEPFDVFICYKETDNNGRRTPDSVLANDLYHHLTQEGFKVFFSRITLEDKLGSAYEPYIFAALNSAKVMVVVGTKPEYFNAVWVKNEWSRYLALIKSGANKILIPAYRDMDPYDLPEEFSHLQAQDMSKLGFMQDLIRGIKKLVGVETKVEQTTPGVTTVAPQSNADPLLERAFMFIEDGDWDSADEYCEKVLDIDPKNAQAYVGKLLVELKVNRKEDLDDQEESFADSNNFEKALRFADEKLKEELKGYVEYIDCRNDNIRKERIYNGAKEFMQEAKSEEDYIKAAGYFEAIIQHLDSAELAKLCHEKAEAAHKDAIYNEAKSKMSGTKESNYEDAIKLFESISDWNDSDEKIQECRVKIEEIIAEKEIARQKSEETAKKAKKIATIVTPIVCALVALVFIYNSVIVPNGKYKDAVTLMENGKIIEAYDALIALDGYKDSAEVAKSIYEDYKKEKLKTAKVGDYVIFGAYEQDNDTSNGKEDIEWIVLEIKDGKALVISREALDSKEYHLDGMLAKDTTWETCTLRKWLNNDFINEAFSNDEKNRVLPVTVTADWNPEYSTNPGNATQDYVFLLSIVEVEKYFSFNYNARVCKATPYAVANGAWESDEGNCRRWWLRSPGRVQFYAANIEDDGSIDYGGGQVNYYTTAVRPAMWIDLNS